MKKDPAFQSFQVALGENNESAVMHISPFSPSSSFIFQTEDSQDLEVKLQKLDNYEEVIKPTDVTILKMDVEGYELSILKGAELFIAKTDWIYVECRTDDTIGCKFSEIYDFLIRRGWEYRGAYDSAFSESGKLLYFDAFFQNADKAPLKNSQGITSPSK